MLAKGVRLFVVLLSVVLVGCATSRSEVKLASPPASGSSQATREQAVVIQLVNDTRVFEEAPRDPSIPSLGFEGASNASEETKARAIGRKRNAYGKALGDVLLQGGQTVKGVIHENLASALTQAGYKVVDESAAGAGNPVKITVDIQQFWAWFQPGFWAITLNTNIVTDMKIGDEKAEKIEVHVEDSRQVATEGAWVEIVQRALTEYRAKVVEKFSSSI